MTVYKALGEEYVEGKILDLTDAGKSMEEARDVIRAEARAKQEPLKKALSPKVYQGFVDDGYSADDMIDFMAYEKERDAKIQKRLDDEKYARDVEAAKKDSLERFSGDSFVDRGKQGLLNVGAELDVVTDYLNPLKDGHSDAETVGYLAAKEEMSKAYKDKNRTPEQKATAEKHEKEYAEAKGVVDTVTTGATMLWDTVSNPSEWDMAGLMADAVNPANLIGGGAGHVAGKIATGTATKAIAGATTGAVVEGGANAGYEYALAKGKGDSDEEAKKAAILGGAMGVAIGVPTGAVGGAMARTTRALKTDNAIPDVTPGETKVSDAPVDNVTRKAIELPEDLAESALLEVQEVHTHSDVASEAITKLSETIKDPLLLEAEVKKRLPVTEIEADYTLFINDGKPVSARLAGGRLRNAIKKSIVAQKDTPDGLNKKMKTAGFTEEARATVVDAYVKQDISVYDAFVGKKFAEAKMRKVRNDTTGDTGINTARETARDGDNVSSSRETALPDERSAYVREIEPIDAESRANIEPTSRDNGGSDGISKLDEEMAGYETTGDVGAAEPRVREDYLVSEQEGVSAEGIESPVAKYERAKDSYTVSPYEKVSLKKSAIEYEMQRQETPEPALVKALEDVTNEYDTMEAEIGRVASSPEKFQAIDREMEGISKELADINVETKTPEHIVNRERDDVLQEEYLVNASEEKMLKHIADPMQRHDVRMQMEREKLSDEDLRSWESVHLDKDGNIKKVGDC